MARLFVRGLFIATGIVAMLRLAAHPDSLIDVIQAIGGGAVAIANLLEAWTWRE